MILNAPRAAPTKYIFLPLLIYAPLKIPLKSFIPNIIATIDKPIAITQSSKIKNKKNVNLENSSDASIGCIILIPKGFLGIKRKKAILDNKASIPKTNDSIEVLSCLSLWTLLFIIIFKILII